jgi:ribosomal protein S16
VVDPTKNPAVVELKNEKLDRWLQHGAQPSETVSTTLKEHEK